MTTPQVIPIAKGTRFLADGLGARIRSAGKLLLRCLPNTRRFDYLYSLIYFLYAHRRLPRRNSGLYNDFLFFRKTNGALEDALSQITSDKVYAKYFIDGIIGEKVTPETYAVFESADEIRRSDLPDRCVLKPAHGNGQRIVFLEDAGAGITNADYDVLRQGLALDVYDAAREINYKNLRKRIICEELIGERLNRTEFKLFCFRGAARIVLVAYNEPINGRRVHNYYDRDWNRLDVILNFRPLGEWRPMPERFPRMREMAEKIAAHFDHVRVDMYLDGDKIYIGELTHSHNNAHARFPSLEREREFSRILFG